MRTCIFTILVKQMIKYELKKIWGKQIFIIAFVLFIVFDVCKIVSQNYENDSFSKARAELYSQVEGVWDMENIDYVVSTYQKDSDIISAGNYSTEPNQPGTVTGYIFGDFGLFSELYEKMNYMYNYGSAMEETLRRASENVDFYNSVENNFKAKESKKIISMYSGRSIPKFYDTDGAFAYISYDLSSVMIIMLIILAVSPVFTYEKETEMQLLLRTSARGRFPLIWTKILVSVLTAVVITSVFTAVDIVTFTIVYKINCFGIPLYSIAEFKNTPLDVSIGAYIAVQFAYKLLGMIVISLVFLVVSVFSPDDIISFCICFAISLFLIMTKFSYSPINLVSSRDLFAKFETVNISGFPVMEYLFLLFIALLFLSLLVCVICLTGRKMRLHKFSLKNFLIRTKELMS